jgi:hypothetical protein
MLDGIECRTVHFLGKREKAKGQHTVAGEESSTHIVFWLIKDDQAACTLIENAMKDFVENHLTQSVNELCQAMPPFTYNSMPLTLSLLLGLAVAPALQCDSSRLGCMAQ